MSEEKKYSVEKTDAEWQAQLSQEEYRVLRQKGTERPFTGALNDHYEDGLYKCKGCGTPLFESDSKFNAGCGWPSFSSELDGEPVEKHLDKTHGMIRTEILCKKCGGHLGHVFNDGPTETGLRYCVNAASIDFDGKDGK